MTTRDKIVQCFRAYMQAHDDYRAVWGMILELGEDDDGTLDPCMYCVEDIVEALRWKLSQLIEQDARELKNDRP